MPEEMDEGHERRSSSEHAELAAQIERIDRRLDEHVHELHANLLTRSEIKQMDAAIYEVVELLADAVLGERRSEFEGGGRKTENGLVSQVDYLVERERNGGRLKVSGSVLTAIAAIAAAIITGSLAVVAAAMGLF